MFIVDFNTLGFIDTEYLLHEVVTRSGRPADTQDLVRIEGPFGQAVAHFHMIAVGNMKFGPIWNMACLLYTSVSPETLYMQLWSHI